MFVGAASTPDRFGYFLPSLTKEELSTRSMLAAAETQRARNWFSTEINAYPQKRLKRLIREGIPQELRPWLWLQLSGGSSLRDKFPSGYYDSMIARPIAKAVLMDVESAIVRQLPGHQILSQAFGLHCVARIAQSYQHHTGNGLQHNTHCMAAFLVSVLGTGREEDCFWIMTGLLNQVLPESFVQQDQTLGASAEQLVLIELLKRRCAKVLAAFAALDCSVYQLTANWFSHLFCGVLPAETTVRVWDCLLMEGPKIAFRVSIALLKKEEGVIAGNLQKIRNMQWRIGRTYNADALLKVAFKGIGSLSATEISSAQRKVELAAPKARAPNAKRLEALLCPPRLSPQPSTSSAASELSTILEMPDVPGPDRVVPAQDFLAVQSRLTPLKT